MEDGYYSIYSDVGNVENEFNDFYVCLFSYRICYVALTGYGVEQQEISVKENHCILRKIHDK